MRDLVFSCFIICCARCTDNWYVIVVGGNQCCSGLIVNALASLVK